MLSIILTLAFIGVVLYLISLIPMDARILNAIYAISLLLVIVWLIQTFTGTAPVTPFHHHN